MDGRLRARNAVDQQELVSAIAIIVVLAAFPLAAVRRKAKPALCRGNFRRTGPARDICANKTQPV